VASGRVNWLKHLTKRLEHFGNRQVFGAQATTLRPELPTIHGKNALPRRRILSKMQALTLSRERNMVRILGGTFTMGSDRHYPEEAPLHRVTVEAFWIDRYVVTNEEFARFVEETGYSTLCEKTPNAATDYPGADPALLVPSSVVFSPPAQRVDLSDHYRWWSYVPGANWRHPEGPESTIEGCERGPVVQIAFEDAQAYAAWAGKTLPTEAEWEFAARGGLEGAEYAWGDEFTPGGKHMANTWQGEFPNDNLMLDGFGGRAPVGSFPPNGYGLYDMIGNVWEWTTDWFGAFKRQEKACCGQINPRGGKQSGSIDPRDNARIPRRVMKGGSYLCAPNYCRRYRPAARMAQPVDTSTCHLGFRCVVRSGAIELA
jgi:formylglycine-generating enzyme